MDLSLLAGAMTCFLIVSVGVNAFILVDLIRAYRRGNGSLIAVIWTGMFIAGGTLSAIGCAWFFYVV